MEIRSEPASAILKALREVVGDSLNVRGVILLPRSDSPKHGTITFNVMDRKNPHFGRHIWTYELDDKSSVTFFSNQQISNQNRNTEP
jgi:hypothetical protein